jgi:putative chitinase
MTINWRDPQEKISKFFTVGEVTQNDDRRIPTPGSEVEQNIFALAKELDKVREAWGGPIGVTSWYRPQAINRQVGGASNSQHLYGSAADIYPMDERGMHFEQWLDEQWGGGLGYGQESGRGFTHVDLRDGGWKRGSGSIRWTY